MKKLINYSPDKIIIILLMAIGLLFFYPVIIQGKIPIPSDTIVGMYHPFRDLFSDKYPNGIPFKNSLITDPVRQQYVWRNLAINNLKIGKLPLWNPYSFSGYPLLANFQTSIYYPLNLLYFIFDFNLSWSIQVLLQPIMASVFMYLFLRSLKIAKWASVISSFVYGFSGFSVAWMEWNTIGHIFALVPLSLFSVQKISNNLKQKRSKIALWSFILVFSLCSIFFAGHLQLFFYSFLLFAGFSMYKILINKSSKLYLSLILIFCFFLFILITSVQWIPTIKFISLSARNYDQSNILSDGWFIPWQNLIQFVVPDFFGNPATGNYWGMWNYGEFIGYISILPLFASMYAILFSKSRNKLFFLGIFILSLLFALPNPVSYILFYLKIPFISTSQPTRLLFLTVFSLCVLSGYGLEQIYKEKRINRLIFCMIPFFIVFIILWLFVHQIFTASFGVSYDNLMVAKRNLIFPSVIFLTSVSLIISLLKINKDYKIHILFLIVLIIIADQFRFAYKFLPFSDRKWIYPETQIIKILKASSGPYRILSTDRRILPGNFSVYFKLQDVSGYDPLYLSSYGKFVSSWNQDKPEIINSSFNRILTPTNIDSFITDLIGVKYILSIEEPESSKIKLLMAEGVTKLYENENVFPRAFFVENVIKTKTEKEEIEKIYELNYNLRTIATTTEQIKISPSRLSSSETVMISKYEEDKIEIITDSIYERMMVLTDIYYPSWKVYIDGIESKIYKVDFTFRGVIIPEGRHKIEFRIS